MAIRFSFRGIAAAGLDLGRVVENSPRLRRFREHLESRLTDLPPHQRRQRAHEMVELFLSASLHDFGGHYVDSLSQHLHEIMRIRDAIRTHYEALRHIGPGSSPARAAEDLPRLFNDMEAHLRALDGTTPANHLTNTGGHVPTPSATQAANALAPVSPAVVPASPGTHPTGLPPAYRSGTHAPEIAAGFNPAHVAPLGRLLGRPMSDSAISHLASIWDRVTNPGEVGRLTYGNSRRLFNNHRNRFWRAVRQDPVAMRHFTDAGLTFGPGPTSAPYYRLPGGRRIIITIDHIIERQANPGRALSSGNLRFSFWRENVVLLRLINALDPFQ